MQNLYKIKKSENIWNPMHHGAKHKSRTKLEHDFHIDQVEPEISNQKKYNHDSNIKFWNVFNGQHTESTKNIWGWKFVKDFIQSIFPETFILRAVLMKHYLYSQLYLTIFISL